MARVLIYRSRLLPISETFVRQHYDYMERHTPLFAGLRATEGLEIDDTDPILLEPKGTRKTAQIAAFKLLGYGPDFIRRIKAAKPDLIHAHFAVDAVDMLPVAKALDIPLLVTLHGYDATFTDAAFKKMGAEGRNFLWKRGRLQREATQFFPVSEFLKSHCATAGYPEDKMTVHYLGTDFEALRKHAQDGPREGVIFAGRLVEKKGAHFLLEAVKLLEAEGMTVPVTILGDGPERARLEAVAGSLNSPVHFLGRQPHGALLDHMAKAKVFSMPTAKASTGDTEGFGLVYIEAQAVGTPAVAFRRGPVGEAVAHGTSGLLAEPDNVAQLAAHLRVLLSDENLREQYSRQAVEFVKTQYDARQQMQKMERIYDDLCA